MRVVEVFEPPAGGVPAHVRDVAEELTARGHEIVVVGPPDARERGRIERSGVLYVPLPIIGTMLAPRADAHFMRALAGVLRKVRPDIVHVHAQKAGILGRLVALRLGIPAIYTPNSFVYRTQRLRPRRGARVREIVNREVERMLGRRSAAIVAVANEEREAAIADRIVGADRVHTIYNGVTCDLTIAVNPELLAFKGEHVLFGLVAALRDQKGLPTLLQALPQLHDLTDRMRFAIVGNGPMEQEVRAAVADGLSDFVGCFAFTEPMEAHLAALDVFVLPSYWEGLPIAALEAMCMGLPVIATAVNGTPEAVLHEQTGLIVAPHDAGALARAIRELVDDAERRASMGSAGRERVRATFNTQRMVDELEALYASVTGVGGPNA
jgi:glycosyltransferase involved in cell wall biosynthesis